MASIAAKRVSAGLNRHSLQFGDPAGLIPVGNVNICALVYVAAVCRAKDSCWDVLRTKLVFGPLTLLWVITDERDGHVVLVEDRDPPMQLRNDRIVSMETDLARTAHMLRNVSHEFAVKIKVAKPKIFPVADQEQRLIVARVNSQSVAAIAFSVFSAFSREA